MVAIHALLAILDVLCFLPPIVYLVVFVALFLLQAYRMNKSIGYHSIQSMIEKQKPWVNVLNFGLAAIGFIITVGNSIVFFIVFNLIVNRM